MSETKEQPGFADMATLDTVSRVYCGRKLPLSGEVVPDHTVDSFCHTVTSSLFPDGYTVIRDANGAWMDQDNGKTIREPTVIFEVAHHHGDSRVSQLAEAWKTLFEQQSVMVTSHPTTVQFI